MSDKLEALSQPVAYTDREELESMRGPNADTYANLWTIPHGCGQDLALYSPEYVTALLAALEEKGQQLARYSVSAGQADQRLCESRAVRDELGFGKDADDVSPLNLRNAIRALRQRAEAAEQRLQQPIPEALVDTVCHTAAEIYRAHDEDKAQDIINRIREALEGFKVEGE